MSNQFHHDSNSASSFCSILVAYLLGLPILGYSLDIGKEHVNLIDGRLEKLLYSGQLDAKEIDRYLPGNFSTYLE